MEKKNSAEAIATTKYTRVRSRAGSRRSNLSASAAHSAVGIATASAATMTRRLVLRGRARMASTAAVPKDADLTAALLSLMPPPHPSARVAAIHDALSGLV